MNHYTFVFLIGLGVNEAARSRKMRVTIPAKNEADAQIKLREYVARKVVVDSVFVERPEDAHQKGDEVLKKLKSLFGI